MCIQVYLGVYNTGNGMCEFKCTWVYKIQEFVYSSVPGCIKYRKWNVCIQVYLGV